MKAAVDAIIEAGGEGVILRKIASLYESGRSDSLIKIKVRFCECCPHGDGMIICDHIFRPTFFLFLFRAAPQLSNKIK
jgi:hypothetical protein